MRRHVAAPSARSTAGQSGPSISSKATRSVALPLRLFGLTFVAAVLLSVFASSAFAARTYVSQLTEANGTAFGNPYALAVDSSDNLWVSDKNTSKISKFDSSGGYLAQNDGTTWNGSPYNEGIAYGTAADKLYVADSNADDFWLLNADATYSGTTFKDGFESGCCYLRDAVDNSGGATDGDLYVSSSQNGIIRLDGGGAAASFSASQSYITANQITGTPDHAFGDVHGVAVDGSGNVYALDVSHSEVDEFDSTGTFVRAFTGSFVSLSAVAIDPTTGNVLIGDSGQGVVHEFDSSGAFIDDTDGSGTPGGSFSPQGLAVDSNGRLYVADGAHPVVDVMSSSGPPPVTHDLTVNCTGTGSGSVAPVDCGVTAPKNENSTVTLTATAAAHSTFTGWTVDGDTNACPGTGTCDVPIGTTDHTVVANFDPIPQHDLTVNCTGTGSGSVSPVDCGVTQSEDENGIVTLTATANSGSTFTGWSGAGCSGTGTCDVTMDADHTVVANFDPIPQHTLTASVVGSGTVTSSPAGINCGVDCTQDYDENTVVTLTATPAANQHFVSWSGDCTGTGACQVTMDTAKSVTATFAIDTHAVNVTKAGAGSGTVTSDVGAIDCGATCSDTYDHGTVVTLTAAAASGSTFAGWSGAGCSGTGTCVVTVSAVRNVTATFAIATHTLTVSKSGSGTVTSSPAGINCGADCSQAYNEGTAVTLTATAAAGSHFVGWSGACTGTGACHVTMSAAKSVTATFATNPVGTCATDPSLCTPGVLGLGATIAKVTGGKAAVQLSCTGETACTGTVTLTAKVKVRKGKKKVTKTMTIGKATIDIAAGGSETVNIKLNSTAKKLLKKHSLKATLTGPGLKHTIVLKAPKKHKK